MNIILDIDGTLVSEADNFYDVSARPYLQEFLSKCFSLGGKVSIWTAATYQWADMVFNTHILPVVEKLDQKIDIFWVRDNCKTVVKYKNIYEDEDFKDYVFVPTTRQTTNYNSEFVQYHKPLSKIFKHDKSYTKDNTIVIDDTPVTYKSNFGNALPINTYTGDTSDNKLLVLCKALDVLKKEFDDTGTVRKIEKRSMLNMS